MLKIIQHPFYILTITNSLSIFPHLNFERENTKIKMQLTSFINLVNNESILASFNNIIKSYFFILF